MDNDQHSVRDKCKAQKQYCQENNCPHFAPYDGRCWCCGNQIYEYYSIEHASATLITGCPHCKRSFVD